MTVKEAALAAIAEGLSNAEVAARVRAEVPGARTSPASVAWYRANCREELRALGATVVSRAERRAANAVLAAYGSAPVKERRARSARRDRYAVTCWDRFGDVALRVGSPTLALARASARRFLLDEDLSPDLVDVAPVGDPEQAVELYRLRDGRVVRSDARPPARRRRR